MRLLSTRDWTLNEFPSDEQLPSYAILSHTWEDEEVDYQQWLSAVDSQTHDMKGYNKIRQFGLQAAQDGFEWIWVDTCCIDKKSSAELTEAVNSMFRWYKQAERCYVYLSDLHLSDEPSFREQLPNCRWFTRGWTLQELIAPRIVVFYAADWQMIAVKDEICDLLVSITGIDGSILLGAPLADISVARRMSWASQRRTTRTEDIAYCLLGIFDINLPLIYGEGTKAFQRLQEAIMVTTYDQSLFAWGTIVDRPSETIDEEEKSGLKVIPWKPQHQRIPLVGLLAKSPDDFRTSRDIGPVDHGYAHALARRRPPSIVNGGVLLDLVIHEKIHTVAYWDDAPIAQPHEAQLAVLLCRIGSSGSRLVGILLHPWGDDYYARTTELVAVNLFVSHVRFQSWTQTRHVVPARPYHLRHRDILLRRWSPFFKCAGVDRPVTRNGPAWRLRWRDKVLRMESDAGGDEEIVFFYEAHPRSKEGVAITFKRISRSEQHMGLLLVGASHFITTGDSINGGMEMPIWMPTHGSSFRDPSHSHVMTGPSDSWSIDFDGWATIHIKADRAELSEGRGKIDIIDFSLRPSATYSWWLNNNRGRSAGLQDFKASRTQFDERQR